MLADARLRAFQSGVRSARWWILMVAGLVPLLSLQGAEPQEGKGDQAAPVSSYAAAKDLERQIDVMLAAFKTDLANEKGYNASKQKRVARSANGLICIAQVLGMHDEESRLKPSAADIVAAARQLRDGAAKFADAAAAYEKLAALVEQPGSSSAPMQWQALADMKMMMEYVPSLNSQLRRGLTQNRFEKSADETAACAATLAAIAQCSTLDMVYCSGAEDEQAWMLMCIEYREAMAALTKAVRATDFDTAKASMTRGAESCKTCHDRFRPGGDDKEAKEE